MNNGRIVVLEGIDGCGKSTVAQILGKKLSAKVVSFPTQDAKSLIASVDPPMSVMSSVIFYMQDMFDALHEVIAPAVRDGGTVILDRFWPSTVVYQGERLCRAVADKSQSAMIMAQMLTVAKRTIDLAMREELGDAGNIRMFTLTIPYREALLRTLKRGEEPDQFERDIDSVWEFRASFYERINFYEDNEDKLAVLGNTPEQVADQILESLS